MGNHPNPCQLQDLTRLPIQPNPRLKKNDLTSGLIQIHFIRQVPTLNQVRRAEPFRHHQDKVLPDQDPSTHSVQYGFQYGRRGSVWY